MMSRRAARRQRVRLSKEQAAAATPGIVVNPVRADEVKVGDVVLRYETNPRTWRYAMRTVGVVAATPPSVARDLRIVFADGGVVYYNAPSELLRVAFVETKVVQA